MTNNKYVLGDVHGRYSELVELLLKAGFDYENDILISLGDLVDRGPEPYKCIFELMKIKNLIAITGNHDLYLNRWIKNNSKNHDLGSHESIGITLYQWTILTDEEKNMVRSFLDKQLEYYIDKNNNLFVHGGVYRQERIEEQSLYDLCENRFFFEEVLSMQRNKLIKKVPTIEDFNEIYIGHTPTICYKKEKGIYRNNKSWKDVELKPINILNVWNMDTGSGFLIGRLSLMNINTKELFQVEIIKEI